MRDQCTCVEAQAVNCSNSVENPCSCACHLFHGPVSGAMASLNEAYRLLSCALEHANEEQAQNLRWGMVAINNLCGNLRPMRDRE